MCQSQCQPIEQRRWCTGADGKWVTCEGVGVGGGSHAAVHRQACSYPHSPVHTAAEGLPLGWGLLAPPYTLTPPGTGPGRPKREQLLGGGTTAPHQPAPVAHPALEPPWCKAASFPRWDKALLKAAGPDGTLSQPGRDKQGVGEAMGWRGQEGVQRARPTCLLSGWCLAKLVTGTWE